MGREGERDGRMEREGGRGRDRQTEKQKGDIQGRENMESWLISFDSECIFFNSGKGGELGREKTQRGVRGKIKE